MGIKNLHTHLINFVSRPNTQIALCCGKTRFLEVEGIDDDSVIRVALDISGWIQKLVSLLSYFVSILYMMMS